MTAEPTMTGFKRLLFLGIDRDTSNPQRERLLFTNGSAIGNGLLAGVVSVISLALGQTTHPQQIAVVTQTQSVVLWLNARGATNLARFLLPTSQIGSGLLIALHSGSAVVYAVPFVVVVIPFGVFALAERGWLIATSAVCAVCAALILVPGALPPPIGGVPAHLEVLQLAVSFAIYTSLLGTAAIQWWAKERAYGGLNASLDRAKAGDRAKSTFLANMSHEIRTPLGAILGYAELAEDATLPLAKREAALRTICSNGEHLLGIVNQILDLSKIQAGELIVEEVETTITRVVGDVASLMRVQAAEKSLEFTVGFLTPIPSAVIIDPLRMRQILINLVGNAIKFTNEGHVRLTVSHDAERDELTFGVEDTGPGIEPGSLSRLFEPFNRGPFRGDSVGGTGLGLTISRSLAELLGGQLSVESTPQRGSVFSLTTPCMQPEGATLMVGSLEGVSSQATDVLFRKSRLVGASVLLADDFQDAADLLAFRLERAGATIQIVGDGRSAVDLATQARDDGRPFDVILMDMQMPVLSGYDATRQLRSRGHDVPIFALTAHAMEGDRQRCLNAGCDHYITKPVDFDALIRDIAQSVTTRRAAPSEKPDATMEEKLQILTAGFRDRLPDLIGALVTDLKEERWDAARARAHKLAGSAGMFGFNEVTDCARRLEQELNSSVVPERIERLIADVQRAASCG